MGNVKVKFKVKSFRFKTEFRIVYYRFKIIRRKNWLQGFWFSLMHDANVLILKLL